MSPGAYYNEVDPYAAAWLRALIQAGLIAPGDVDERSIVEVQASEIRAYTQWHLFAGIAGWSRALRLAQWPDDRPVLTASVPCQPFSSAGRGAGHADERNLWPHAFRLIRELRPESAFGEQVDAAIGYGWLDRVCADLESDGYACAAVDLPAASVGAPHIRQRLFWVADAVGGAGLERVARSDQRAVSPSNGDHRWVADAGCAGAERGRGPRDAHGAAGPPEGEAPERERSRADTRDRVADGGLAEPADDRLQGVNGDRAASRATVGSGAESRLGDADGLRSGNTRESQSHMERDTVSPDQSGHGPGQTGRRVNPWADAEWLPCLDGKARRAQSGLRVLVDGVPFRLADGRAPVAHVSRAALLKALGNAIIPQVAAAFVMAYMESRAVLAGEGRGERCQEFDTWPTDGERTRARGSGDA